jgi:hypothetical protein
MELAERSLKGQLGHASALGASFVAIVEDSQTVLRDMREGTQAPVPRHQTVAAVLEALKASP